MTRALCLAAVAGVWAAAAPADQRVTIWSGIYTESQALRGEAVYPGPCGKCHGARLDGAPDDPDMESTPPVAGAKFLREWDGRSVAVLYQYVRTTMPTNNPGFLSEQEFIDIVAYMLSASGAPAGDRALAAEIEALGDIVITSIR